MDDGPPKERNLFDTFEKPTDKDGKVGKGRNLFDYLESSGDLMNSNGILEMSHSVPGATPEISNGVDFDGSEGEVVEMGNTNATGPTAEVDKGVVNSAEASKPGDNGNTADLHKPDETYANAADKNKPDGISAFDDDGGGNCVHPVEPSSGGQERGILGNDPSGTKDTTPEEVQEPGLMVIDEVDGALTVEGTLTVVRSAVDDDSAERINDSLPTGSNDSMASKTIEKTLQESGPASDRDENSSSTSPKNEDTVPVVPLKVPDLSLLRRGPSPLGSRKESEG